MVVKKSGTPVSAKKKNVEEMKKLNEKKKMMMQEESEEEEETSEEEDDDDDVNAEGSDEGDNIDEDEDDDDDDDDDEEDDDDDEEDDDDESDEEAGSAAVSPKKQQKDQIQTLAKSKTPNKKSILSSPQKSEVQSSTKTPNKRKSAIQNESLMTVSSKKLGKSDDDSARTPFSAKQQKDTSAAKGTTEKRKREAEDDEGVPKKPRSDTPSSGNLTMDQKRQRDVRCLFIRQFPIDTSEDDIKALSSDIVSVRIPPRRRKGKYQLPPFGFVEFASEEKAEENFPVLQKAKLKGQKLYVDFVGEKSKNFVSRTPVRPENKKKLFITGLPSNATMEDIAKSFPNAMSIFMKSTGNSKIAHIEFETESAGEEACQQNSSLKIKGQIVTVMFAFTNKPNKRKATKTKPGQQKSLLATNQKTVSKKPEKKDDDDDDNDSKEEDDDDDDDNDSEEDDDDDDDDDSDDE